MITYRTDIISMTLLISMIFRLIDLLILNVRCKNLLKRKNREHIIEIMKTNNSNYEESVQMLQDGFHMLDMVQNKLIVYISMISLSLFFVFNFGTGLIFLLVVMYVMASLAAIPYEKYIKHFLLSIKAIELASM